MLVLERCFEALIVVALQHDGCGLFQAGQVRIMNEQPRRSAV